MDKWPPDFFNPRDPDWTNVARAAEASGMSEKAIRENVHLFGVFWFSRWYVSLERLLSTRWSKPATKKKADKDQLDLGI